MTLCFMLLKWILYPPRSVADVRLFCVNPSLCADVVAILIVFVNCLTIVWPLVRKVLSGKVYAYWELGQACTSSIRRFCVGSKEKQPQLTAHLRLSKPEDSFSSKQPIWRRGQRRSWQSQTLQSTSAAPALESSLVFAPDSPADSVIDIAHKGIANGITHRGVHEQQVDVGRTQTVAETAEAHEDDQIARQSGMPQTQEVPPHPSSKSETLGLDDPRAPACITLSFTPPLEEISLALSASVDQPKPVARDHLGFELID